MPAASDGGTAVAALVARLATERRALALRAGGATALGAFALLGVVLAVAALALGGGRWLQLPRGVPALAFLSALLAVALLVRAMRRRATAQLAPAVMAAEIEEEQGLRAGSLRGALEVAATGPLGARAAADIAGRLSTTEVLAPRVAARARRHLLAAGGVWVIGALLTVVANRIAPDGVRAAINPIGAWRGTLLPALGFVELPLSVPRGMPLTLRVAAAGRREVTVSLRAAGESWRDTTLTVDAATGDARLALGPVVAPLTVRATDGRAQTDELAIAIDDRGWIGDVAVQAEYPAYLARNTEVFEAGVPVRVPRGTILRVRATLHGGARDARLVADADTVALEATDERPGSGEGAVVLARLVAERDGAWRWVASATPRPSGETPAPELPDALLVTVLPDQPPQVVIIAPRSDTAIASTGVVPILIDASDDHGVSHVALSVWREATGESAARASSPERIDLADPGAPLWEGGMMLPLDGWELEAGDRLHVVAIATDNSPWRQVTRSRELVLRVPSLSEQRAMARSLADSLAAQAARAATAERMLQQATSDASRSRELQGGGRPDGAQSGGQSRAQGEKGREGSMTFSAAERARRLAREQQQLGSRIDSMRQSARELEERLQSAGALDREMADRMRDVQRMLREAITPEMRKQLADLEQSAERLSGSEARQSLEQLSQQQRQAREQLERSAEMLKRAALEGAMQTLRDEAKELAEAEQRLADQLGGPQSGPQSGPQRRDGSSGPRGADDPQSLADRSRALERDVQRLGQRLEEAGAKPGASRTRAAQPMANEAASAMQRAAQQLGQEAADQARGGERGERGDRGADSSGGKGNDPATERAAGDASRNAARDSAQRDAADALAKAMAGMNDRQQRPSEPPARAGEQAQQGATRQSGTDGPRQQGAQTSNANAGPQSQRSAQSGAQGERAQGGGQQPGGQRDPNAAQQAETPGGRQGQGGARDAAAEARRAADAMGRTAQQLADARAAQVDAWKTELSQQLDQSINETMQLARQQQELEDRMRQQGAQQGMQGEQGAVQQGVQQAAERMEAAGRSSSLVSQRSQRAMGEAQQRVSQATQAMGSVGQPGGAEAAQNAMRDASEALNQALSSLVRDRERVNQANSASGFSEMLEQLRQLAQQQGSLNGQMQGLNLLPGGAQGQQARQQARVLARQQREVARTLMDVSDADPSGRTDALAREAQQVAQQLERSGLDPAVAARQQQLYRRLLDAGRFLEQDERDDQGPREARAGSGVGAGATVNGPAAGRAANRYAPPTWNDLRGLGPEERRLVIEYFRRLNGGR
jgi:hypothetical protein